MKYLLFLFLSLGVDLFPYQQITLVDNKSEVSFRIKNLGIGVNGSFNGLEGKGHFDPKDFANSYFEASVDANTVNTGIDLRNSHLRKEEYFDVKNYPTIKFVSTKVTASTKEGVYFVFGKLTIKKTTKEISFPFTAETESDGIRFKGEFKLNRLDYEVGESSFSLSDNATVSLSVFAKK
jgi:polyisoprenoid-binding protein YceI